MVEVLQDGVFLSFVQGDVADEGAVGASTQVGDEEMGRVDWVSCADAAMCEVVFEGALLEGAGVSLEDADGDELGIQRLVYLVEQVFIGEVHFFSFEFFVRSS